MTTPEEMDESLWRFWNAKALKQADRIEQLMKERDEERTKRKMAEGLARLSSADIDGHSAMITVARDAVAKRMAAEAKLTKTVEALREIEQYASNFGYVLVQYAGTKLAELEAKE